MIIIIWKNRIGQAIGGNLILRRRTMVIDGASCYEALYHSDVYLLNYKPHRGCYGGRVLPGNVTLAVQMTPTGNRNAIKFRFTAWKAPST